MHSLPSALLELKLLMVASHHVHVEMKLRSFGGAAIDFYNQATSLATVSI